MKKNKSPKVLYISAPYRHETSLGVTENICYAERRGREMARKGWAPIVIHTAIYSLWGNKANTYGALDKKIVAFNLAILKKCDAMLVCRGKLSKGMQEEIDFCRKHKIEIIYENRKES